MSRRSHRHNRDTDDDLYGNWAARDSPSGSHSAYGAGSSYTQHGSSDRGYGDSSYGAQSSYSYSGGDPNYGRRQQQQYQEQSGGYGSQRSQGYSSGEDDISDLTKCEIAVRKNASLYSTGNRDFAARMAAESSTATLERFGEDQSSRYTGASDRTAFSNEFASRVGDPFSSQSRAQEEEARIARQQQLDREERNRREFGRHRQEDVSRYRFDDDADMDYGDDGFGRRSHGRRRF